MNKKNKTNKTNKFAVINKDTGEVVDNVSINGTYSGVTVHTQEQDKYNDVRKIIEHKNSGIPVVLDEKYGKFVHSYFDLQEPYLQAIQSKYKGTYANIHIVRFLLLASFVSKNGYININGNKQRKSGLKNIWQIDKGDARKEFHMLCSIGYISTDENDYIIVNQSIVNKGKAHQDTMYTRLFSDTIQDLYYSTEPPKRKQLAYIYKLIPYVNRYHNIVCSNPIEPEMENIHRLDWKEIGEICGYHETQLKRFRDVVTHFRYKGQPLIGQFMVEDRTTIIINPAVYYAGSNKSHLHYINTLFKLE